MNRSIGAGCSARDRMARPGWVRRGPTSMLATLAAMLLYTGCSAFVTEPADIFTPVDDRTEAARFVWKRENLQTDVVTLSGPFATNRTTLERRGSALFRQIGTSLQPIDRVAGTDPVSTALSTLPPEAIGNWLLGHKTESGDWQLNVMDWQNSAPWKAPKRVTIRGADMEIKLIISQWSFEPIT